MIRRFFAAIGRLFQRFDADRAFRVCQIALLGWIAYELHTLHQAIPQPYEFSSLSDISHTLSNAVQALQDIARAIAYK